MAFSRGNLQAKVKSGQMWVAGVRDIGKLTDASLVHLRFEFTKLNPSLIELLNVAS
jgi:hypothetical protein